LVLEHLLREPYGVARRLARPAEEACAAEGDAGEEQASAKSSRSDAKHDRTEHREKQAQPKE
jgi:hypothetical protein